MTEARGFHASPSLSPVRVRDIARCVIIVAKLRTAYYVVIQAICACPNLDI